MNKSPGLWRCLQLAFVALLFYFVGLRIVELWNQSPDTRVQVAWPWLMGAWAFNGLGWLPSVAYWRMVLQAWGHPVPKAMAARAYYVGQLGKYVPGKAIVIVMRARMIQDAPCPVAVGGLSAVYETLAFMGAGAAIAAALAPLAFGPTLWQHFPESWHRLRTSPWILPLVVGVATTAALPLISKLFSLIAGKMATANPEFVPRLSVSRLAGGLVLMGLGWTLHACSLGCVLAAVGIWPTGLQSLLMWLGCVTLATVGGFVVLLAPGGLGVREYLFIESLSSQTGIEPAKAILAALLLRATWLVADLTFAALLYFRFWQKSPSSIDPSAAASR